MRVLCPTCGGKKTITDPTIPDGVAMGYCDGQGNSMPQVACQTCGGSGWVEQPQDKERSVMDINDCVDCKKAPEYVLLKSGHTIICSKCGKSSTGFKRKEYAIEEWNYWNEG